MNSATQTNQFVDDVVVALIGSSAAGERPFDIVQRVRQASADVDQVTAESFGAALVEALCEDSSNLDLLEALLVLGLAHPQVPRRYRMDHVTEAKRFATLLERSGQPERARHVLEALAEYMPEERTIENELAGVMRRNGDVDELIERYLARADEAVAKRRPLDAVPWLQEVLLLDRNRRDVARMIRDLRYSEVERKDKRARRNLIFGVVMVLSMLISGIVIREMGIRARLNALPSENLEDVVALRDRVQGLETILADEHMWFGMYGSVADLNRLKGEVARLERRLEREAREAERLVKQRSDLAEAARQRGLRLARQGEFEAALRDLRHSLELTSDTWEHRERVLADIAAIETHRIGRE